MLTLDHNDRHALEVVRDHVVLQELIIAATDDAKRVGRDVRRVETVGQVAPLVC